MWIRVGLTNGWMIMVNRATSVVWGKEVERLNININIIGNGSGKSKSNINGNDLERVMVMVYTTDNIM